MGVCNCSMFCCTLLYVHFSIAIILMGKRELIALLNLSSWCLVMVERLFLTVPRGCLQFVIVVFPDHTHLLFLCLSCFTVWWSTAGKGLTYWLLFVMFNCVSVTFPCGILRQVWYLIVSIPDLCRSSFFIMVYRTVQ